MALRLGSIYGLIAIGYTMVYGIIGMINFAHGDIFMVGAFISLIAILAIGLTASASFAFLILALILVLVIAMILASAYQLDGRARRLSAVARLVPAGAAHLRHRHVDRAPGIRPHRPGRPAEADAADHHRRHRAHAHARPSSGEFVVRLSNMQIIIIVTTLALMTIFTAPHHPHLARPRPALLRAGHEDGLAARHRRQQDHLHHLRHGRGARRGRRASCSSCATASSTSTSASSPALRPSPRRCSAASARSRAPCWAASSSASSRSSGRPISRSSTRMSRPSRCWRSVLIFLPQGPARQTGSRESLIMATATQGQREAAPRNTASQHRFAAASDSAAPLDRQGSRSCSPRVLGLRRSWRSDRRRLEGRWRCIHRTASCSSHQRWGMAFVSWPRRLIVVAMAGSDPQPVVVVLEPASQRTAEIRRKRAPGICPTAHRSSPTANISASRFSPSPSSCPSSRASIGASSISRS